MMLERLGQSPAGTLKMEQDARESLSVKHPRITCDLVLNVFMVETEQMMERQLGGGWGFLVLSRLSSQNVELNGNCYDLTTPALRTTVYTVLRLMMKV